MWKETSLSELLCVKHGFAFRGEFFGSAGTHVVLTPGNFHESGGFKFDPDKARFYSGPIPSEYVLYKGDLLVAMTEQADGLLGSSALVPESGYFLHNQRLGLVQPKSSADVNFLYYLFNSKGVRNQIKATSTGTKVRHTAPVRIESVRANIPPLPIQRRIASILSAYDDLIENHRKRIAILEDMARRLYREWFVHFRYPGHESVPLVDSPLGRIPQRWKVKPLGEEAVLKMGTSPKGDTYNEDGVGTPLVNGPVEFGDRFTKRVKWTTEPTRTCEEGDLIVCVRGSTTGKNVKSDGVYCLGRGVCGIRHNVQPYIDQVFQNDLPALLAQTSGSTFPSWTGPQLNAHPVLSPPSDLLAIFGSQTQPADELVSNLAKQIDTLRRTRDLLLPRLMSGTLSVEALATAEAAVP